ncbi:hypothetical protein ACEUDP_13910 [Aeromonas caviae]|uniref:hypothetical protein n=1 Tax=Aeromonas caviae TaxID=648 RepID=UPI0038D0EAFD
MNSQTGEDSRNLILKVFYRRTPKAFATFSLFCLGFLILKIYILDDIPEIFNGAYKIGLILEAIILSIVSSFVFFLSLNTYSETKGELKRIEHLKNESHRIIYKCQSFITAITYDRIDDKNIVVLSRLGTDSSELKHALEAKKASDLWLGMMSNRSNANPDWIEYIKIEIDTIRRHIDKINRYRDYYDDDTISIVDSIYDARLYSEISWLYTAKLHPDSTLACLHTGILDFAEKINHLKIDLYGKYNFNLGL